MREIGDRRTEGVALGNLAGLFKSTGRLEKAGEAYREAIAIHRSVGHRRFEAAHSCEYAGALVRLGQASEAREVWRAGSAALREIGNADELAEQTAGMRKACLEAGIEPFE